MIVRRAEGGVPDAPKKKKSCHQPVAALFLYSPYFFSTFL